MNATFLNALATIVLGVWLLIEALDDVGKTADIILAIIAIALAAFAAFLSMPHTRARP